MKRKLLLVAFAVLCAFFVKAQQPVSILSSDIAGVGSTIIRAYDSVALCVNLKDTIIYPHQVWNYSTLQNHRQDTIDFVNPASTPYGDLYPAANLAGVSTTGEVFYFENNDDSLKSYGYVGYPPYIRGNPVPVVYSCITPIQDSFYSELIFPAALDTSGMPVNGMERYHYDVTYFCGDTVTVPQNYLPGMLLGYGILTPTKVDSFRMISWVVSQYWTDGWGTLITPDGSYETLLKRTLFIKCDTLFALINGSWDTAQAEIFITDQRYEWWAENVGLPLVEMDIVTTHGTTFKHTNVYWTRVDNSGINNNEQVDDISIFPNPASDVLNVSNDSDKESVVTLYDVLGKKIEGFTLQHKEYKQIPVKELSNGMYFISIQKEGKHPVTRKIMINH